ncbi:RNA polymerase subunit sigma-24 [Taibaiella sp. KBW10]|uniref:RNA polymerase sigma factor n=1 Tax=Taibaiella sp. KBW10 TaxID=2153357 RepID=UPI000F58FAC7|nr:sigma-70 family RNA polymerase sigma factor [Taibaiella sp. KBW10]RQO32014.1 RNA polymerase subunit sigma-24 [Taibaiella sp. KBW10]
MTKQLRTSSDQELIVAFQENKSEVAIAELISRYKKNIFTTIVLKVKDRFIAEDLFQETFIKIVNTILAGKYADQGKFLPWAVRIANNLCIDYFRKNKSATKVISKDSFEWFEYLSVDYNNAESQMEYTQMSNQVQHLLDRLPEEQRDVILLRVYADLSFKEIAQVTNVGINTALGRMRYGLSNLRKIIEEHNLVLR